MSNKTLTIKDTVFNVTSYEIGNSAFDINIEKNNMTLNQLEQFLDDSQFYEVWLKENEDIGYGFDSEYYKTNTIEELNNEFHISFVYHAKQSQEANRLDLLEAKLDYVAMMGDIDLEEEV